jgi:hypothetical protein
MTIISTNTTTTRLSIISIVFVLFFCRRVCLCAYCVLHTSIARCAMRFGCTLAAAGWVFGDQPDRRTIVGEIIVPVSGGQRTEATSGTCYRFDLCTPVRFAYIITYMTIVGGGEGDGRY